MAFVSKLALNVVAGVIFRVISEGFYDIWYMARVSLSIFAVSYVFDVIARIYVHKDVEQRLI